MPVKYSPAPQVQAVAQDIIREHHTHLITNDIHVMYLFTDQAEKVKSKRVLGTARKVSGLNAYLARVGDDYDGEPDFFLICIWGAWWRARDTTDAQRRALVDHELCHLWSEQACDAKGNLLDKIDLSMLPHDLEEFNCIVDRHGDWDQDITNFIAAYNGEGEGLFQDEQKGEGKAAGYEPVKDAHGKALTTRQATRRYAELEATSKARPANA